MKTRTLIVLDHGNDSAFDETISSCCLITFIPFL